jgi:predicted ester cyclase
VSGESIRKAQNQVPMRAPPRLRSHMLVKGFENRRRSTESMVWLHKVNGDPVMGKDKKEMKRELGLVKGDSDDDLDEETRTRARGAALPAFNLAVEVEDPVQRAMPRAFLTGLSEIEFIATSQASNDGIVAARWEVHGKHTGDLLGVAPTGKAVSFSGITVIDFNEFPGEDGKRILRATDDWTYWDLPALMEQIGATP